MGVRVFTPWVVFRFFMNDVDLNRLGIQRFNAQEKLHSLTASTLGDVQERNFLFEDLGDLNITVVANFLHRQEPEFPLPYAPERNLVG